MRKRLVRKAFDMILGISCSENRDVKPFPFLLGHGALSDLPFLSSFSFEVYCRTMNVSGRTMANF